MSTLRSRFLVSLAVAITAGCADAGPTGPITHLPRDLTASETHLVAASNGFAFRLLQEVALRQSPDANVFISPLSVSMALGMTWNGAAGTTEQAMQSTLGLAGMSRDDINQSYRSLIDLLRGLDSKVAFTLANSIWYRQGFSFEPAFFDVTRTFFDAQVTGLDFGAPSAVQTINDWVNAQTQGKITEIVDGIPLDVVMYLINAIHFKGDWVNRFDASLTRADSFTLADGSSVSVPMMGYAVPVPVRSAWVDGALILDLRYGGGAYSMTIVLPPEGAAMDSVVAALASERWDGWIDALDSVTAGVRMPKFKLEFEDSLNGALTAMGMGIAFSGAADFSRMSAGGGLYIDEVLHKTYVDVNEEGTEAAAVTSVSMVSSCCGPPWYVIDRPFLFVIRERFSGTILFMGRIMNPAAS